jgi:sugar lactone lactonase YvrE
MTRRGATVVVTTVVAGVFSAGAAQARAQQVPGLVAAGPNTCLPGTGSSSWCGDGGPATSAKLASPVDVAVASDGTLIIADAGNSVIRRVTPDGMIGTLAGDGTRTLRPPADVASSARPGFHGPRAVAVAPDGTVLVADTGQGVVRRIAHDGRIRIVMGGPRHVGTRLAAPTDVLALPNGDVLVADSTTRRVVRRTAAGAVELVAGSGGIGSTGDGGPATAASFVSPTVLAAQSDGGLLIGDRAAGTIRRVDPAGVITTVAQAPRHALEGLAVAPDGAVLASLRRTIERGTSTEIVRYDGTAGRIAGTGSNGFAGDGPATAVALDDPTQLAVAPDGTLLIADTDNDRIRRLTVDGRLVTVAGSDRPGVKVASVPPPRRQRLRGGRHRLVPPGAPRQECYSRKPRFETFNFTPLEDATLPPGRPKVTLFIQTSVMARVVVVLRRDKRVVRRRLLERVSNRVEDTPVTLRIRLRKGSRYFAEMDGRSLAKPTVYRCDRRRVDR